MDTQRNELKYKDALEKDFKDCAVELTRIYNKVLQVLDLDEDVHLHLNNIRIACAHYSGKYRKRISDLKAESLRQALLISEFPYMQFNPNVRFNPKKFHNDIWLWLMVLAGEGLDKLCEQNEIHLVNGDILKFEDGFLSDLIEKVMLIDWLSIEDTSDLARFITESGKLVVDTSVLKVFYRSRGLFTFVGLLTACVTQIIHDTNRLPSEKRELILRLAEDDMLFGQLMRTGADVANKINAQHIYSRSMRFKSQAPIFYNHGEFKLNAKAAKRINPKIVNTDSAGLIRSKGSIACPANSLVNLPHADEMDSILMEIMRRIVTQIPDSYLVTPEA